MRIYLVLYSLPSFCVILRLPLYPFRDLHDVQVVPVPTPLTFGPCDPVCGALFDVIAATGR